MKINNITATGEQNQAPGKTYYKQTNYTNGKKVKLGQLQTTGGENETFTNLN